MSTLFRSPSAAALCAASLLLAAASARAADHADHADHGDHAHSPTVSASAPSDHAGHAAMPMRSPLGPHAMTRDGSGTAWQPEATPMAGLHATRGAWQTMLHGYVNLVRDRQGGPRGGAKEFAQTMLMGMAQRPLGAGTFGLRAMVSLDPAMGAGGYPLLLQTGETADGRTHLVDRQHPHDALMELAASYALPFGRDGDGDGAVFAYAGLPGEPALGPGAFMHRYSAQRNPEAPLTHHWLDSTHIAFGVVTLGASRGGWQAEASWFNGREPDQHRWNVELRRFDSWSARLSWHPAPWLAMQASYGDLKSPEQLSPETRVRRLTASASTHFRPRGAEWATTLAWGRNDKHGGDRDGARLPGWLLESTLVLRDRHTVFGRVEQVANDELFGAGDPLHDRVFTVRKWQLGYLLDIGDAGPARWGVGVSVAAFGLPAALEPAYGRRPRSTMVFLQGRL